MTPALQLETPRLLLRRWHQADREPFAAINADPVVMEFFAAPLTRAESDEAIDRYLAAFDRDGFSFFAAIERTSGTLIGTIGLQIMRDHVPNLPQPAVEIGWRLAQSAQGKGYATEGAQAVVDYAFNQLALNEVVAITAIPNQPSRRVMEKLGMTHRPELDFDHPRVPTGHQYQRHTLYSLSNPNILRSTKSSSKNLKGQLGICQRFGLVKPKYQNRAITHVSRDVLELTFGLALKLVPRMSSELRYRLYSKTKG